MPPVDDRIREAASAVVARDGEEGLEVVVVERSAASRFLPGYVAFPGGSTEQEDRELARRWFGTPEEARRACAVRELAEEVSFVLTLTGLTQGDELDAIDAAPPSAGQLPELAHWVAPPRVPVRFDARYFAVRAPAGIEPVPDGGETADAWWVSPPSGTGSIPAGARTAKYRASNRTGTRGGATQWASSGSCPAEGGAASIASKSSPCVRPVRVRTKDTSSASSRTAHARRASSGVPNQRRASSRSSCSVEPPGNAT